MKNRWVLKSKADEQQIQKLATELNINPLLTSLLIQRGHNSFEKAKLFFRPSLSLLHDPFLMKDMEIAVTRIEQAIKTGEKILIYGDYDVDGTTAVSLVYTFLIKRYPNVDFYIPDRYKEGYGISSKGIEWAAENDFKLIIALDCGIKAIDKVNEANNLGIDFIICDHHRPGENIPDAYAVLDPKRPDCNYPFKELSGCGVGFKLIHALLIASKGDESELDEYLDLVVVSIAADIVSITGENRTLAYFGLKRLNSSPRPGIRAILHVSKSSGELNISDIVFTIAPRINAAGRIESGRQAVELLVSPNFDEALHHALEIDTKNTKRKGLNEKITKEALELINNDPNFSSRKTTVLFNPKWHKGVIGIVASKLIDEYYRPTVILTSSEGMISGSARSVKDFDVYNAIESCSDLLDQFGGHMYAAGLAMKEQKFNEFKERFESVVSDTIEERMLVREIEIDHVLSLGDINPSFFNVLKQFEPFGPGNMAPIFKAEEVYDKGRARIVGNNHLKMQLIQNGNSRVAFDSIGFNLGSFSNQIPGKSFDVCFNIEENRYNGRTSLQLNIKDISVE